MLYSVCNGRGSPGALLNAPRDEVEFLSGRGGRGSGGSSLRQLVPSLLSECAQLWRVARVAQVTGTVDIISSHFDIAAVLFATPAMIDQLASTIMCG